MHVLGNTTSTLTAMWREMVGHMSKIHHLELDELYKLFHETWLACEATTALGDHSASSIWRQRLLAINESIRKLELAKVTDEHD